MLSRSSWQNRDRTCDRWAERVCRRDGGAGHRHGNRRWGAARPQLGSLEGSEDPGWRALARITGSAHRYELSASSSRALWHAALRLGRYNDYHRNRFRLATPRGTRYRGAVRRRVVV